MTKLCPDTIRACIEALPKEHGMARTEAWENGFAYHLHRSRVALERLLPMDPADRLVFEWLSSGCAGDTQSGDYIPFARWLISSGKMKGE